MTWFVVMITGICVIIIGSVMTVRLGVLRLRGSQRPSISPNRLESMTELASQVAVFAGMAMIQLASTIDHMSERTSGLSLAASVAVSLTLGVHLGRLLMRWQLWQLDATIDGVSGKITRHEMS